MMASEKISNNLKEAENQINNNILDSMNIVLKSLEKIEQYSSEYTNVIENLRNSYYEIQEAGRDIENFSDDMYYDEQEQSRIEERIDLINSLKRKYGSNILEILDYKEKLNSEIFEIENLEDYIKSLKKEQKELEEQMIQISEQMHIIRCKYSENLILNINKELSELEMNNAKFNIKINLVDNRKFNSDGLDEVEFLISTNIGEESKSLVKIASGGEMSRIMLAIKNVLANVDKIPVVIFDEIDTGISGIAANATGEKMKQISKSHQVICVTHLASIAAKGDYNYFVGKEVENNKTKTKVRLLEEDDVLKEIARISTGTITDISINHARELRKRNLKEIA